MKVSSKMVMPHFVLSYFVRLYYVRRQFVHSYFVLAPFLSGHTDRRSFTRRFCLRFSTSHFYTVWPYNFERIYKREIDFNVDFKIRIKMCKRKILVSFEAIWDQNLQKQTNKSQVSCLPFFTNLVTLQIRSGQ